ncbi:winged helix-turn-helix transcriptional regulator [[Eubacterium] cellulosolvens]
MPSSVNYKYSISEHTIRSFQKIVYEYYRDHGRRLPWRETKNPYHILVSEIMLQQTPVQRVQKKYKSFLMEFPDFPSLTKASLLNLLISWRGLGYNRRAIALKKAAKIVVTEYAGILPSSTEELSKLPGVGRYTASAVCAFAFDQPTIFIETNIRAVFIATFFQRRQNVKDSEIIPLIERTLDWDNPREWYYALMDYGDMLKRGDAKLIKRSAQYARQPPFQNSDRHIRGMILKELTAGVEMSERQIAHRLNRPLPRIQKNLEQLEKEGFITNKTKSGIYIIADE